MSSPTPFASVPGTTLTSLESNTTTRPSSLMDGSSPAAILFVVPLVRSLSQIWPHDSYTSIAPSALIDGCRLSASAAMPSSPMLSSDTWPSLRSTTYTSRCALVSAGTSCAYEANATNRPSALTATSGESSGERCESCSAMVMNARLKPRPTEKPGAAPRTIAAPASVAKNIARIGPSIRGLCHPATFLRYAYADLHGTRRFEHFPVRINGGDARVGQGGSRLEIDLVELFDDVLDLVRDELDLIFERVDADGCRQRAARLPDDARHGAVAVQPPRRHGLQNDREMAFGGDPQALPAERRREPNHPFQRVPICRRCDQVGRKRDRVGYRGCCNVFVHGVRCDARLRGRRISREARNAQDHDAQEACMFRPCAR